MFGDIMSKFDCNVEMDLCVSMLHMSIATIGLPSAIYIVDSCNGHHLLLGYKQSRTTDPLMQCCMKDKSSLCNGMCTIERIQSPDCLMIIYMHKGSIAFVYD